MKKIVVLCASAAGAGIVLFGATGTAVAADDVVGQTYADAASTLEEAGLTTQVGAVFGNKLPLDECIVTSVSSDSAIRPGSISEWYLRMYPETAEVTLSLNCNG